jgi:hypothetical protein
MMRQSPSQTTSDGALRWDTLTAVIIKKHTPDAEYHNYAHHCAEADPWYASKSDT